MRDCTHPNIVQYYGAYLEAVRLLVSPFFSLFEIVSDCCAAVPQNNTEIGICMEFCEAGSLERLYKLVQQKGYRTGEKVLGKIAESVSVSASLYQEAVR